MPQRIQLSRAPNDIVRDYFPDATDAECDYILWEHTGFPGFFRGDPEAELRGQLVAYAAERANTEAS